MYYRKLELYIYNMYVMYVYGMILCTRVTARIVQYIYTYIQAYIYIYLYVLQLAYVKVYLHTYICNIYQSSCVIFGLYLHTFIICCLGETTDNLPCVCTGLG